MILSASSPVMSQLNVKGKITNSQTGEPIVNASIALKGTPRGTYSDDQGNYSIDGVAKNATLVFSSVGFINQEQVAASSVLNVQLSPAASQNLKEVLVVGFGTKIKRDLTGNIAQVKGSVVENMPVTDLNQAIQGRAAGVFVEAGSGKLGEGVQVLIRGSGSISASTQPLYVIDGVPISTDTYSGSAIADINFNDIESFDILKDASAAAIYGSRAANGVVLITTKKGKAGKTIFNFNSQYGFNSPTHLRGFLDARQYTDLLREAAINSDHIEGVDPTDPSQYSGSWLQFAENRLTRYAGWSDWRTYETNTNWQKKAFYPNPQTGQIDLSASGGNEKTKFYLGLGYTGQEGILIGNNLKRASARLNLEHAVSDKFKLGMNFSVSRTTSGRVTADNEFNTPMQSVALSPVTPFRDKNGVIYTSPTTTYANPYVDYAEGNYKATIYRNIGNVFGQYNFTKDLFFRSEFGVDVHNENDDMFYGARTAYGKGKNGYGESDWYMSLTYNTNNYFSFKKTFNEKHAFDAVLGMSYQEYSSEYANVYGEQFPVDDLQKLASAGLIKGGTSVASSSAFLSYFARANYKFDNKYLLSVSGRVDGSSVFGADKRYGVFPAVSAGWVLSEENFLKNNQVLSFLKLRASWGLTGNADGFGDFSSRGLWGGSSYNGLGALVPTQMANQDLRWEKSNQTDIGLDFGFLDNRISGEIDYYNRNTDDLIYNVPVPGNTGFTNKMVNIGAMNNRGFEFVLNTDNVRSSNFKWSSSLNLAFNKNKITKLDGDQTLIPGNDGRYMNSLIVGQPIGVFYGPKFAGADPANGDALYYLQDGKTTTNDYDNAGNFILGNPNPKLTGGFNNTFSAYGFDLSFLFQGVFGNKITNGAGGFMSSSFAWFDNQTSDQLKRWQKPGDISQVPELRLGYDNGTSSSSRYVYDGSYVRLKNITLGYSFSKPVLNRLGMRSLRVYVTGVNVLTFTNYPGWDPEVNADYRATNKNQGGDFYSAPQIKNISFGLNIGF